MGRQLSSEGMSWCVFQFCPFRYVVFAESYLIFPSKVHYHLIVKSLQQVYVVSSMYFHCHCAEVIWTSALLAMSDEVGHSFAETRGLEVADTHIGVHLDTEGCLA